MSAMILRYESVTGLSYGQLHELSARILQRSGEVVRAGGRPAGIGLFRSVAMVVTLMRKNITQEVAWAIYGPPRRPSLRRLRG